MNRFIIILFLFFNSSNLYSYTILLDPGHGGEDIGAVGKIKKGKKTVTVYEKDLTLSITKLIFKELKKTHSVFMTRSIDRTIPLLERAQLAEKIKADLFISVHLNSSRQKISNGFETFYLDNHKDKAVKKVEDLENLAADKNTDHSIYHILTDLVIQRTVKSSKKLASIVHKNISKVGKVYKMSDRGMKAGFFYVLILAKRPGILLEVGFMSNEKELKLMLNPDFQKRYARAVVKGIRSFVKSKIKKKVSFF